MNANKCDSFASGLLCSGQPNSEMCKQCPSMTAGHWRTPTMCKMYIGKYIPKQPKDDIRSAFDSQEGGTHYKVLGIQPMELTLKNMGYEAFKGACYTKINKYMIRKKDNEVEQLKKARHVLDMWIEEAQKQQGVK